MLIAKLLTVLTSLGSSAGFYEHEHPSYLQSMLTRDQAQEFIKAKAVDQDLAKAVDTYVEGIYKNGEEYYCVVINFLKPKGPEVYVHEESKEDFHPYDVEETEKE